MTLYEALEHVKHAQKAHAKNAEQCESLGDAVGYNYHKREADAMEIVLDEVNRLSKELLVAVAQR